MQVKKVNLSLLNIISIGIGSIVGAGIFALLGQVILQAGELTYLSFLIGAFAAIMCGYSYAKLAGTYPQSGGLTEYFRIAFKHKWISGGFTIIYYVTSAVSICMIAKSFGIYINELLPAFWQGKEVVNALATVLIVSIAFLNMLSTKDVGRTETILVATKMGILLLIILAAFAHFDLHLTQPVFEAKPLAFLGSIGITFFAYAGFGVITNGAADVENPKRTMAWGIYLTLLIVALLYVSLAFVILNFIPFEQIKQNADVAVALAARKLLGETGYVLIYIAAVIAFISAVSATFFSIFRISRSLARQEIFPHFYNEKFWQKGSWGNFLTTGLIVLATVFFDFTAIVNLASGAYLVSYLAVFAANWRLRKETGANVWMVSIGFFGMLFILLAFLVSIWSV